MDKQTFIVWQKDKRAHGVADNAMRLIRECLKYPEPVQIVVSEYKQTRSTKQRNSLFGVAYKAIMEQTGLSGAKEKEQLHTFMCGEFFGWKDTKLRGRVPVRTTTTNEAGEREEIDRGTALEMYRFIQREAGQCGVNVPEPDPLWHEDNYRL